jgi:hypothetical protein
VDILEDSSGADPLPKYLQNARLDLWGKSITSSTSSTAKRSKVAIAATRDEEVPVQATREEVPAAETAQAENDAVSEPANDEATVQERHSLIARNSISSIRPTFQPDET